MFCMAGLTADQIIERIANAKGIKPEAMRKQIEKSLQNIVDDMTQPHASVLTDLFHGSKPTADELVVALEYELYETRMPIFSGWQWDGEGYCNVDLLGEASRPEPDQDKLI